jgi:uncharacterized protein
VSAGSADAKVEGSLNMSTSPNATALPAALPAALPIAERVPLLDVLRGFALMGILIMNMPGFSYSGGHEADGSHYWPAAHDQFAEEIRDALFSGKFNSLFSLLFGLGFTIQFARMQQADPLHANWQYLKRVLVLLVFGVVHACVFWDGDVLHIYAVLGIVLLFGLRRVSDRGLVWIMGGCLVYPLIASLLRVAFVSKEFTASRVAMWKGIAVQQDQAFGQGGFFDAAREYSRMMLLQYTDLYQLWGVFGWYVSMTLTMLIGVLAGRRLWAQRAEELMPQVRRLTWVALGVGLVCSAAFTVIFWLNRVPGPSLIKALGGLCYNISRPAMMIFYVLAITQLFHKPSWKPLFAPFFSMFAAAGRMPLTNYLMQTAICTLLFNGWGFGLWGKVGPAAGFALSLAIFFVIQVPWSFWWLKRHERGPMEALWARFTYGRRQPTPTGAAVSTGGRA